MKAIYASELRQPNIIEIENMTLIIWLTHALSFYNCKMILH